MNYPDLRQAAWLVAILCTTLACATTTHGQVRQDAARHFSCAPDSIRVQSVGPTTLRAVGCGQSALYACSAQEPPATSGATVLPEHEARNATQRASCHRVSDGDEVASDTENAPSGSRIQLPPRSDTPQ